MKTSRRVEPRATTPRADSRARSLTRRAREPVEGGVDQGITYPRRDSGRWGLAVGVEIETEEEEEEEAEEDEEDDNHDDGAADDDTSGPKQKTWK